MTSPQIKNAGFGGAPSFYPEENPTAETASASSSHEFDRALTLAKDFIEKFSASIFSKGLRRLSAFSNMGCSPTTVGATPNSASTEGKSPPDKKIEYSHSVSAPTQTFTVIAPTQQTVTAEKHQQTVTVEKYHTEVEVKKSQVEVTARTLHYSPLKLEQALQWGQPLNFSKLLKPGTTVTQVTLQYVHNDHWQPQALKTEEVVVPAELMKKPGQYVLQVSIKDPSAPNSAGFWLYFNVESPKP